MKKIVIAFIVVSSLFLLNTTANAQCKQQLVYQCATSNNKAIYLRDFNAKLKKTRPNKPPAVARFSVVLNKGTNYRFNLCNMKGFEGRSVLTLYDPKRVHGSTYNKSTDRDWKYLDFICQKSGVYFVSIKWKKGKDDKKGCAVGIMSFVGKNK